MLFPLYCAAFYGSEASYREDQSERIYFEGHISYCLKWILSLVSKSMCDKLGFFLNLLRSSLHLIIRKAYLEEVHLGSYKKIVENLCFGYNKIYSVLGSDLFNCGINVLAKTLFIARKRKPLKGSLLCC